MSDRLAARLQMATSLAFHIVFAVVGIALLLMMVIAEALWLRAGEPVYRVLARRWATTGSIRADRDRSPILGVLVGHTG